MDATGPPDLADRLRRIRDRVALAAQRAGRTADDVAILLAVKAQTAATARAVIDAGGHLLGHNRAQELLAMGPALAGHPHAMHFIGHLQSNKVNHVLPWVSCIQTVDSPRLAAKIDRAAARSGRVLDVFVQVNTSREPTKSGVAPAHALELTYAVGAAEHLRLRGLMTVGALSPDPDVVHDSYRRLADLRDAVVVSGVPGTADAAELSMGMSNDLELAIEAGSTMVRIGSAVFGPRPR